VSIPQVLIRVGAQVGDAVSEFGKLDRAIGDHLTKTEKVQNAVRKAAIPAGIALAAMGVAAVDATRAAADDAEAQTKLAGTLDRVTNASSSAIAAADDYISSLSQQVGVADDELRPALGKLATATGDLTEAQKLLGTALDISAQTGKPLDAVTTALSKAYAGNEGALKKLLPGIDEGILKSGDFTKVQAELARLTGGAAAESAGTAAGQFRRFQITMQETKEAIGAALLPVFNAFLPILQKVASWAQRNSDVLVVLGGVVAGVAAAVVLTNAAMSVWNTVSAIARAATVAFTVAQAALNVVLAANPIGIVILALGALVTAVVLAYQNSETFRGAIQSLWDWLKKVWDFLQPIASTAFEGLKLAFEAVTTPARTLFGVLETVLEKAKPVIDFLKPIVSSVFDGLKTAFTLLASPITLVKLAFEKAAEVAAPVVDFLKKLGSGIFSGIAAAFRTLSAPVNAVASALRALRAAWDALPAAIQGKGGNIFGPGGTVGPVGTGGVTITGPRQNEILVAPSAQYEVDEEALARGLYAILMRSDGRNGTPVFG